MGKFMAIVSRFLLYIVLLTPLTARANGPNLNPNQGPPSTHVIGSGTWAAGDQLQIIWPDGTVLANTTVQQNNTYSVGFNIPASAGQRLYQIQFFNSTERTFLVADFTVTQQTVGRPSPPSNVAITDYGSYNFHIDFTDSANNETAYEVFNGNETRSFGAVPGSGSRAEVTWTGVKPNSYMCVRVRATNQYGASEWEPSSSPYYVCATTPPAGAPVAPSNVTAKAPNRTTIRICWKDKATNETAYLIFNGNVQRTRQGTVPGKGRRACYNWRVRPGTYMCARVRAYNEWGTSPWAPSIPPYYACIRTPG